VSDDPVPFIVGVPRSGTTLLRAMLAAHPDLTIPEEADFRVSMSEDPRRYEGRDGLDVERFVADLLAHPQFHWWGLPEDEVRAALSRDDPRTFSDGMRALFHHCALKEGKPRHGDKTPRALLFMPHLAQLFPEARFIHIIRDGRDVALSHVHTKGFIRSVGEVALTWKEWIERGRKGGEVVGPGLYREVRYERLIEDPEEILRSLCLDIELAFHQDMLRYFERPLDVLGTTQQGLPGHPSLYLPPTKELRDWRQQMSWTDLEVFEAIAGEQLDKLGYERAIAAVTVRARVRAEFVRGYVAGKRAAKRRIPLLHRFYVRFLRGRMRTRR
jgi:hypothetical protein